MIREVFAWVGAFAVSVTIVGVAVVILAAAEWGREP